jgi:hypothetical protein
MLADLKPTLVFLCPRPSSCPGASRLTLFAERAPDTLLTPLLVVEVGGYFALPPGSLLADMDGEGEDVEECMPFVIMPGGLLTLEETDCDRGAMIPPSAHCPTLLKTVLRCHILSVRELMQYRDCCKHKALVRER